MVNSPRDDDEQRRECVPKTNPKLFRQNAQGHLENDHHSGDGARAQLNNPHDPGAPSKQA